MCDWMGEDFQKCIKLQAMKYRPGGVKFPVTLLAPCSQLSLVWVRRTREESNKRSEKGKILSIMQSMLYGAEGKNGKHTDWQKGSLNSRLYLKVFKHSISFYTIIIFAAYFLYTECLVTLKCFWVNTKISSPITIWFVKGEKLFKLISQK